MEDAVRAKSEALHEQRRRIARDLHDIVAHDLTVISMHAQAVDDEITDPVVRATLETNQGASAHALQDLRRMLDILRNEGLVSGSPSEISAARLDDEIARCASILRDLGFTVELDVPAGLAELPMSLQSTLRWVLQECTTNVAKHGDARGSVDTPNCRLSVEQEPNCVSWRVANTASSRSGASGRILGVGSDSMRHRVESEGGRFDAGYRSADVWEVRVEVLRRSE
ncbi:histidine kinase [Nesterenkonia sp. CL21]|uniref:sensor histidine kinase n=1 Tax=Nesterenkonia sp. CL21 TaxID=3064894 RepID=UPI0028799FAC|nr:histidine kinase [Nesterenkonia sp. CL21]MDS2172803.1 histidine kinase [Nesterenkonia sp. CL21]